MKLKYRAPGKAIEGPGSQKTLFVQKFVETKVQWHWRTVNTKQVKPERSKFWFAAGATVT